MKVLGQEVNCILGDFFFLSSAPLDKHGKAHTRLSGDMNMCSKFARFTNLTKGREWLRGEMKHTYKLYWPCLVINSSSIMRPLWGSLQISGSILNIEAKRVCK